MGGQRIKSLVFVLDTNWPQLNRVNRSVKFNSAEASGWALQPYYC
jgi:hypothetical protein